MVQADDPEEIEHAEAEAETESERKEQMTQALRLVQDMSTAAAGVSLLVDNMVARVRAGLVSTDSGLSFLEVKYHSLLSYLIDVTFVVLRKCAGAPVKGDPAIDRLVEMRTVLEKMRPLEAKLKYRIDKLAKTGPSAADDPTSYRPHPENVPEDDEPDVERKRDGGVYVPPKLAAADFAEVENAAERERKRLERSRRRALESSVVRELREEFSEAPAEISSGQGIRRAESKRDLERTEYEETYLTRLPTTKADRKRRRGNDARLGDRLTSFGDYDPSLDGPRDKKKKKINPKKGKPTRRRRFH